MTAVRYAHIDSAVGPLLACARDGALTGLALPGHGVVEPTWVPDDAAFTGLADQLAGYGSGDRTSFDVPLAPAGTPFQRDVWAALMDIPYGETISYGALAARIGRPRAVRAVGRAVGANPIAVVVPCHRVISADGTLGGYAGGLDAKRALLRIERQGAVPPPTPGLYRRRERAAAAG